MRESKEPKFLITGITGTMGQCLTKLILRECPNATIVGISRDEQKQQAFPIKNSRVRLKIANVQDRRSLYRAAVNSSWEGYSCIFHLAAVKCAPFLESNPWETVQTNVVGTQNVVDLAQELGSHVVLTSTDKACKPINIYGITKAAAERLVLGADQGHTVLRYGNVLGSRGSVLPRIVDAVRNRKPITITDPRMTRFWLTAEDVAQMIWENRYHDGLYIPSNMRSSTIEELVDQVEALIGGGPAQRVIVGMRPGEKIHEDLDEHTRSNDQHVMASHQELRDVTRRAIEALGICDLGKAASSKPAAAVGNGHYL